MFLRNPHPWLLRLTLMLAAMSLFVLGYQWGNQYQRRSAEPPRIAGVLIRPPVSLPAVRLQDPFSATVDHQTLAAGWTLLAIGDLAGASGQRAVQRLIEVYNRLADQPVLRQDLRLVFITTTRTPSLTHDFAALSPALRVLGGETAEIARLGDALGLDQSGGGDLYVLAPGGQLLALLPASEAGAAMADDLTILHHHASLSLPEHP